MDKVINYVTNKKEFRKKIATKGNHHRSTIQVTLDPIKLPINLVIPTTRQKTISAFHIHIHAGIIRSPQLKSNILTNRMQDKVQK